MDEADNDILWSDSKRMGVLGVSVRKMKALTVTVTLTGKDR